MDIENLLQEMHDASTESEKQIVETKVKEQFDALSDLEKKEVKETFLKSWENAIAEGRKTLARVDREIEELKREQSLKSA
ncbi:hypothetical protein AGMMS49574_14200 [Bacteroidia bacterium]|nr:hypothetical protein AGMMS49574_14200 [Bacteroidia bacterium]GHU58063.1 hypothetical protein FACS189411_12830 [Bacteroidia bacterium]